MTRLGVSDSVFLGGNPPLQPIGLGRERQRRQSRAALADAAFPQNITTQDRYFRNPEAWAWNADLEREIGLDTTVEVGYVGRRGLHAQRERNINQLQPARSEAESWHQPRLPAAFKGFNIIRVTNNDANSMYNGFQVGVNRRFTKGFSFGVAYTLSKSEDDGSAQRDIIPNAYDGSNLWGPSTFDRRHVLVVNFDL